MHKQVLDNQKLQKYEVFKGYDDHIEQEFSTTDGTQRKN